MQLSRIVLIALLGLVSACSSSNRPVYSGHEESTKGVPGFSSEGKKLSPHVKLGQSYRVNGETYVPRYQPDYVEEGMASWYGPGFHGGKTANGESFDEEELTAAHRTLPLPSIVRVTLLSTGKSAYVRVNDRGPFAHNRIIDVSRGVAEKIGLIRAGVGKVRVEYLDRESKKFAELLADGRSPKSIDIESEVLNANTEELPPATLTARVEPGAAPVSEVVSQDLMPPASANASQVVPAASTKPAANTPFDLADANEIASSPTPVQAASVSDIASAGIGQSYVQIGAFQNEANAARLVKTYAQVNGLKVEKKINSQGITLYHVRQGPFADASAIERALGALKALGADAKIVKP
jgi:rare lipoprotein A